MMPGLKFLMMGQTIVLMAARYSASERGKSELDQAMLTFLPSAGLSPGHGQFSSLVLLTRTLTYLLRSSSAGKEVSSVMAVNRNIKDLGVRVELLLCPVTMMNVLQESL